VSNRIDARQKVARQTEQEYAHTYPFDGKQEGDYQYPNEDKRVGYHANDPDDNKNNEELYNVQPEVTINNSNPLVQNTPVVTFDPIAVVQDHRQRSYRIKNKPQIYDKMDLSPETYALPNNPREDEVNKIKETAQDFYEQINQEEAIDRTSPNGRFSLDELKVEETKPTQTDTFQAGDQVEDEEMGLKGKVAFIGRNIVSVVWNDNTRERMNLSDASKFLKKAYVDPVQERVSPLETPSFPKSGLEQTINNALSSTESSEDEEVEGDIDIEKVKLQRKVNELQAQVNEIDIQKIKEKAASEIIDLMQKKGMLGKAEEVVELQMAAIMAMDDQAFETYKQAILGTKLASAADAAEIEALLGDDDYSDIEDGQEYARTKEAMKKSVKPGRSVDGIEMGDTSFFENGGLASNFRANVGDFSSQTSGNSGSNESRKLATASQERKAINRKADTGLDFSSFNNLQGLTTPINIPNKDMNAGAKFADLFSDMGWSGTPKKGSNLRIGR
jgi:hypothetical protein